MWGASSNKGSNLTKKFGGNFPPPPSLTPLLKIMKKLKFLLPDKKWSDMLDITVIMNYGYNGYKGYNSYKGYNRYNGYNGYNKLCWVIYPILIKQKSNFKKSFNLTPIPYSESKNAISILISDCLDETLRSTEVPYSDWPKIWKIHTIWPIFHSTQGIFSKCICLYVNVFYFFNKSICNHLFFRRV